MPKKRQDKQVVDQEAQKLQKRNSVISTQVLHKLGKPIKLQTVQVRLLWENYYRVNIITGDDVTSASIVNSYFLEADSDGNIIASTPELTRQY